MSSFLIIEEVQSCLNFALSNIIPSNQVYHKSEIYIKLKKWKKMSQRSLLPYARMTVKRVSMVLCENMLLQYVTKNSDERSWRDTEFRMEIAIRNSLIQSLDEVELAVERTKKGQTDLSSRLADIQVTDLFMLSCHMNRVFLWIWFCSFCLTQLFLLAYFTW